MAKQKAYDRPAFLDSISRAYARRRKSVVLLTGATHDLFFSREQKRFLELEQTLFQALNAKFLVQRLDISTGLGVFDDRDMDKLNQHIREADALTTSVDDKIGDLKKEVASTRHSPLPALVLLREMLEALVRLKSVDEKVKPVCTIVKFAGSLLPSGNFDQLGELDRQRLVTFLNLIESPSFRQSNHLIILVADTKSEVNSRIVALPSVECIEIELPNEAERSQFVDSFLKDRSGDGGIEFEGGKQRFVEDTAGLTLTAVEDLMQMAHGSSVPISRADVLSEINEVLTAELGDIIKVSRPEHGPADIIGYQHTGEILRDIFRRCEDPETAVPAILISGPNGAGKTFQLEAYAAQSGRVVIELAGLRGQYFGQTDQFFEKLRLRIKTYGKILILVDEAHTAFGSVHSNNTHETEKRLAGNIIKMMGDRTLFGKVLWGLMTSRPDELDPDVKSRAPIQIPIFDLEGDERRLFVEALFKRKKVSLPEGEVEEVLSLTASYSNRDFDFLVKEVKGSGRDSVLETLRVWQASSSIRQQRMLQTFIAAQHCSYPALLPADIREFAGSSELDAKIQELKYALHG